MPKIRGYNHHAVQDEWCNSYYDDQLAILKNTFSPADLSQITRYDGADSSSAYIYVDDNGLKRKVKLSDLLNEPLIKQIEVIQNAISSSKETTKGLKNSVNTLKTDVSEIRDDIATINDRLKVHHDRLDRERELEWKQLNGFKADIDKKQDKLQLGEGLSFDENNVLDISSNLTDTIDEIIRRLDVHRGRLDRERYHEWKQLLVLRKIIERKQEKLIAGNNITIDENNVISASLEAGDLSRFATKEELEELRGLIPSLEGLATKAELEALRELIPTDYVNHTELNAKQDKLTAGRNITIENNVISAAGCDCTECTIGLDFTTNVTVGNLPKGTEIKSDDTLAYILQTMLMKPEGQNVTLYIGTTDRDVPDTLLGLVKMEASDESVISTDGFNIAMPEVNNAHLVLAVQNDYTLTDWIDIQTNFGLTFGRTTLGDFNVYYINEPDYDMEDDGKITQPSVTYKFKFRCSTI